MAQFFKAFGRTITIDDEFMALLERNLGELNDTFCEGYLLIEFGKNKISSELPKYTDEELSNIVKKQAADELIIGEYSSDSGE